MSNQDKQVSGIPFSIIVAGLVVLSVLIFIIQNYETVKVKIYFWNFDAPLALLLFMTFGIGILVTILISIPGWNRRRKEVNHLKKLIK